MSAQIASSVRVRLFCCRNISGIAKVTETFRGLSIDRSSPQLACSRWSPVRISLPPSLSQMQITVPALKHLTPMLEPNLLNYIEKFDPIPFQTLVPKIAPSGDHCKIEKQAARKLGIRKRRMRLHKLRKLYRRDHHQILSKRREKEALAEKEFRANMVAIMHETDTFNPKAYVQGILDKCAWKPEPLSPSGRKIYDHWTKTTTVEDLYNLPKTDYIHKDAVLPSDEDWAEIQELRAKYYKEWKDVNEVKKKK